VGTSRDLIAERSGEPPWTGRAATGGAATGATIGGASTLLAFSAARVARGFLAAVATGFSVRARGAAFLTGAASAIGLRDRGAGSGSAVRARLPLAGVAGRVDGAAGAVVFARAVVRFAPLPAALAPRSREASLAPGRFPGGLLVTTAVVLEFHWFLRSRAAHAGVLPRNGQRTQAADRILRRSPAPSIPSGGCTSRDHGRRRYSAEGLYHHSTGRR
jgi:hypothetical protein